MKIAVTGGKGGTGKSMVATSLAVEFAKIKKTMLVDADVECPNDYLMLSIKRRALGKIWQPIPKWDFKKCTKCGKCAFACKQNAIAFAKGKYPAFIKENCIGCKACLLACPENAISEDRKEIGKVHTGNNYGVYLVSGELKLGEHASGEVVSELRKRSDELSAKRGSEVVIIDSAAGIGCPVIASLVGTDYIVAVTEPTPAAFQDLKRILYLAGHFKIRHGLVINKSDLDTEFCKEVENFARKKGIPILGKIPYKKDFVRAAVKMKPVTDLYPKYSKLFGKLAMKISSEVRR
ncbi:MAG: ATP-binding protein [Candidatus Aenigmarchaeota archaeon]|nr:ATP-binding protein [Candidatus Aenigmarchaeota archaeon]